MFEMKKEMKHNRPVIIVTYYHTQDFNCFNSDDFTSYDLVEGYDLNIKVAKSEVSMQQYQHSRNGKNFKISSYASSYDLFIIYIHINYCTKELCDSFKNRYYKSQAYARELINKFYKEKSKEREEERRNKGYVICSDDYPKAFNELRGHLPLDILIDNLDYLGSGYVGGYFGHSHRTLWMDDIIKEIYEFSKEQKQEQYMKQISQYLNHSDARHWMDNIDYDMDHEEFRNRFIATINGFSGWKEE